MRTAMMRMRSPQIWEALTRRPPTAATVATLRPVSIGHLSIVMVTPGQAPVALQASGRHKARVPSLCCVQRTLHARVTAAAGS